MLRGLVLRSRAVLCTQNLQSVRYCSQQTESTESSSSDEEIKGRILQSALLFVPEHGWSQKSIQLAVEQEGLPSVAHGIFQRGGIELVEHFYVACNEELAEGMRQESERVAGGEQVKRKTNDFIYDNLRNRLLMVAPYKSNWHQAMALMTLPQNARIAWMNLHHLSDDIWYYAGDRSLDINYYTKRLTLAALYKSTELYMLQDSSPDQQDTWHFLHRRMEDLSTAGKCIKDVQKGSGRFGELAYSACMTAQNILGMNNRNR